MTAETQRKKININGRVLSVIVFTLFFAWLLAFPFEWQILYAIADSFDIEPGGLIFWSIAIHFSFGGIGCRLHQSFYSSAFAQAADYIAQRPYVPVGTIRNVFNNTIVRIQKTNIHL